MKILITLKGLTLTEDEEKKLGKYIQILKRNFINFADDTPELSFMLKKHDKNKFISGTLKLTLPRKHLIARIGGHAVTDIIHEGFGMIQKEYEAYRAKYFKGYSKYPHHESIRTDEFLD